MTTAKLYIIPASLFFLTISIVSAQLMENNNATAKADKKIKMEIGYYKHLSSDDYWPDSLCLMWRKEYDTNGLLVKLIDHWQCGQIYCIYEYEYNNIGKCVNSWISYQSNKFKRTKMMHKYDDNGNLIERQPEKLIPRFPLKETYEYNEQGQAINWKQWRKRDGQLYIDYSKDWRGETNYNMTLEYKIYDEKNKERWTVIREIEYHNE